MIYQFVHPIIASILIAATYFSIEYSGILNSKSLLRRAMILVPAFMVVIILLEIFWPSPGALV